MRIGALRVVERVHMTEAGEPVTVRRGWRDRWLSRPWRPWVATRIHVPQVPSRRIVQIGNSLVMHPAIARELRAELEARGLEAR